MQPIPQQSSPVVYQPTSQDKQLGNKFNRAVIITALFIVLSHSYKFAENAYFMFTSKSGELFNSETCSPTMKGYVIVTVLFFIAVLYFTK